MDRCIVAPHPLFSCLLFSPGAASRAGTRSGSCWTTACSVSITAARRVRPWTAVLLHLTHCFLVYCFLQERQAGLGQEVDRAGRRRALHLQQQHVGYARGPLYCCTSPIVFLSIQERQAGLGQEVDRAGRRRALYLQQQHVGYARGPLYCCTSPIVFLLFSSGAASRAGTRSGSCWTTAWSVSTTAARRVRPWIASTCARTTARSPSMPRCPPPSSSTSPPPTYRTSSALSSSQTPPAGQEGN